MVSESLDVQILVKALYDFESDDTTNLTFKKDDVIQVLAQLESGWWAGYCDGRQGWFPSNYVEVLGEEELDSQEEEDEEYAEGDDLDVSTQSWPHLSRPRPCGPTRLAVVSLSAFFCALARRGDKDNGSEE